MSPLANLRALILSLIGSLLVPVGQAAGDDLDRQFLHPPDAVRPQVEWHWMNGNVTKEGITLDLEAMRRVGIRGAQIWNAAPAIPPGPAQFMTPEWREMMRFAITEAARLGIETGFHNADGWSSSGGPWVPIEQSMMELTWSETSVTGGKPVDIALKQPFTRKDFYRDVALLAVPAPPEAAERMRDLFPKVTTSLPDQDGGKIVDGNSLTLITGPVPSPEKPQTVLIELAHPLRVQTLNITTGPSFGAHGGFLEASEDGHTFWKICDFQIPEMDNNQSQLAQGFEPVTSRYFRLTFNKSDRRKTPLMLSEIELSPEYKLEDWRAKAGFVVSHKSSPKLDRRPLPEGQAIPHDQVIDLTKSFGSDGRLRWDAQPGQWRVLRFGYTTKDKQNKPASSAGRGYECDKMSKDAVDTFWNGMVKTVLDDNRDQAGKSLRYLTLDSFEVGTQNYTPEMPRLFKERTGYSMIPYLPALTGAVVDSVDVTERFLWDYRRVIADLWKECYFEHLNALAEQNGLLFNAQVYGNGNFDVVSAGTAVSAPASEFWIGKQHPPAWGRHRLVASAAHLQGRSTVFAESFTASPQDAGWRNSPALLKVVGDRAFCDGVNAIMFHTYAHQPWIDARPGMTMGPFGMHFNRGNTWWEYISPWMDYLARCQLLLRKGTSPVDLAVFTGENSPVQAHIRLPLEGYYYEYIDRFFLEKLQVEGGRLVLPSGMSYRALYIPPEERGYSLPVLRAIRRLVSEGATVVVDKPGRTPSLQNFPESENEVAAITREVWGDKPSTKQGRSFGKGRIIPTSVPLVDVLRRDLNLPLDCVTEGPADTREFAYIHRVEGKAHYYFLSNQSEKPFSQDVRFHVTGLQPELWDPMSGEIRPASGFSSDAVETRVPIELPPAGSVFVVFRERAIPLPATARTAWDNDGGLLIESPWRLTFSEKNAPERHLVYDRLKSWTEETSDDFVRYFSGTVTYETEFELPEALASDPSLRLRLDLGRVEVIANVELNGRNLGDLWAAPFQTEITGAAKPGTNRLKIRVANLWPNRLIGDQILGNSFKWDDKGAPLQWPKPLIASEWPEEFRDKHWASWRHFRATDALLPSGLLGPVKIQYGRETAAKLQTR